VFADFSSVVAGASWPQSAKRLGTDHGTRPAAGLCKRQAQKFPLAHLLPANYVFLLYKESIKKEKKKKL